MGSYTQTSGWRAVLLGFLVALASVLAVLFAPDPAFAGNWNHDLGGRDVNFQMCELSNNTHDAFRNNGDHDIGPTAIVRHEVYGCYTYDVFINDFEYGKDDAPGFWHCHKAIDANTCDHSHAHINTSYEKIPEDYYRTLAVVCEEIGHSVGLHHRPDTDPDTCMSHYNNNSARHLDGHDAYMINIHY